MKQKLLKIIWVILVLLVIIVCVSTMGNVSAINPNSEKIAQLSFKLNELESQKYKCLDNLTYKQTVNQIKWFNKYCVEYDEQIMEIQEQIDKLKTRDDGEDNTMYPNYDLQTSEELNAEWYPWKLTEDWSQQEMPVIQSTLEHNRFIELSELYWLDASMIWEVENHYWIKEWVVLCITIAETSWGNRWAWGKNIWSVGSNDRGDRPTYALMESWLEAIWKTLTNKYLGSKKTLWCLSNAGSCTESWDNGKRYATSEGSRQKNMSACLSTIYWTINPSEFNIRR